MNKPLHDKHFFNCPCWKGILTKIEGIEKPTYAVWNAFGGPWPLVITISEGVIWVWKKIYWRKKNLRKNEVWWNLMKSDFIRFHFSLDFFPPIYFFQTQVNVKPKYRTHLNNKITPNYLKINFKSAGWWTLWKNYFIANKITTKNKQPYLSGHPKLLLLNGGFTQPMCNVLLEPFSKATIFSRLQ